MSHHSNKKQAGLIRIIAILAFTLLAHHAFSITVKVCIFKTLHIPFPGTPALVDPWVSSDPSIATIDNTGMVYGAALGNCTVTFTDNNGVTSLYDIIVEYPIVPTISLTSAAGTDNQVLNFDQQIGPNYYFDPLTPITYSISSGSAYFIPSLTSLPNGVNGSFSGGVFTISGTPYTTTMISDSIDFYYTIEAVDSNTCHCEGIGEQDSLPRTRVTGKITLAPPACQNSVVGAASNSWPYCDQDVVTLSFSVGGDATGASISGLPANFTSSYSGGTLTATGVISYPGFSYTVTTSGGACDQNSLWEVVSVHPPIIPYITLTSSPGTDNQTVCAGNPIEMIQYNANSAWSFDFDNLPYWTAPDGLILTWNGVYGTPLEAGVYTYTVSSYYICYGDLTITGQITVIDAPQLDQPEIVNPSCNQANGTVTVNGSGTGNLSWTGTGSGTMNNVSLPVTISGLSAGTYSFSLNSGNCNSNLQTVTLTEPPMPSTPTIAANSGTTICAGDTLILTSSSTSGNVWSTGATSQSITVTNSGTYFLNVLSNSCFSDTAFMEVSLLPSPEPVFIMATGSITFCDGGSVELIASSGNNFTWSPGNQTSGSIVVNQSGTYTVTVNENGCSYTSPPVNVLESLYPNVTLSDMDDLCNTAQEFALSNGLPAFGNYVVNGTETTTLDPGTALLGPNTIQYTFENEYGCASTATTTVNVLDCLSIDELSGVLMVNVFPNPTNGLVQINLANPIENTVLEVKDQLGRILQTDMIFKENYTLDLSALDGGYYFIYLKERTQEKIVKIQLIK